MNMRLTAYLCFMAGVILFGLSYISSDVMSIERITRARQVTADHISMEGQVGPYTQSDILMTLPEFIYEPLRILVFDGRDFTVYKLFRKKAVVSGNNECHREGAPVPVMVDALLRSYPERFVPGSRPFQLLFTTNDCVTTHCVNGPSKCSTHRFAPLVAFSTVPKNKTLLPTVQVFPTNGFVECIFHWRTKLPKSTASPLKCGFPSKPISPTASWMSLKPQIIWRGNDFRFSQVNEEFFNLKQGDEFIDNSKNLTRAQATEILIEEWGNLVPRWRGVLLSLLAESDTTKRTNSTLPWIDCKFFVGRNKGRDHAIHKAGLGYVISHSYMDSEVMSKYRYQIDFGGAGGTTWLGTINKLAMPGLLFHQETPMKDWFFDDMKPWIHYVPIKWDLSDLRQRFEWAEANPDLAEMIAQAGTQFALNLLSEEYLQETYKTHFERYLGRLVRAYQPAERESLKSIVTEYQSHGFEAVPCARCYNTSCIMKTRTDSVWNYSLPLEDRKYGTLTEQDQGTIEFLNF